MATDTYSAFNLEAFSKEISKQKFPPVEQWNPEFCGDIDMQIASDGTWYYMGTPITRERMVRLFSTVLRKDEDEKTYLVTPVEKIGIQVEDAHFIAVTMDCFHEGREQYICFTTNVGDKIIAAKENPVWVTVNEQTGEPRPYLRVRGKLDALISRTAFYQLVEMAESVEEGSETSLIIKSDGEVFSLGSWSDG